MSYRSARRGWLLGRIAIKDAVRPELYIKVAIVILGGFFERRANPDTGRMEQAEHAAASKHYKY